VRLVELWLQPRRLAWLAALCCGLTVAGVLVMVLLSHGLILPNKRIVGGDFLAFWSAGRLVLEGRIAEVHAAQALLQIHHQVAPGLEVVYLWHHPPTFLLVATALATLPYLVAIAVWLLATGLLWAMAVRAFTPDPRVMLFAFAAPGVVMHLGNAQTGLLFAAICGFALLWLDRRPLASGVMIGLFVLKPHLAVLFPVALATSGRWRTFWTAALCVLAVCGAAYVAFGPGSFTAFLHNLRAAEAVVTDQRVSAQTYVSLYGNLIGLGVPELLANFLHWGSAGAATGYVWRLWRRGNGDFAMVGLVAGSLLISPYLFFYDLTLLLVAGAFLVRAVGWDGLTTCEKLAVVLAWAAPGLTLLVGNVVSAPIGAVSCWLLLWIALRRSGEIRPSGTEAPAPAPTPQL
jgi:alpha-1,2-mannosyltransferase